MSLKRYYYMFLFLLPQRRLEDLNQRDMALTSESRRVWDQSFAPPLEWLGHSDTAFALRKSAQSIMKKGAFTPAQLWDICPSSLGHLSIIFGSVPFVSYHSSQGTRGSSFVKTAVEAANSTSHYFDVRFGSCYSVCRFLARSTEEHFVNATVQARSRKHCRAAT